MCFSVARIVLFVICGTNHIVVVCGTKNGLCAWSLDRPHVEMSANDLVRMCGGREGQGQSQRAIVFLRESSIKQLIIH